MADDTSPEIEQLRQSWIENAEAWTDAVRSQRIESRRLVTDAAILTAVLDQRPARVLDLGCGEGWLVRQLSQNGVRTIGVDASAPLIERARASGGEYVVGSYDDLIDGSATFDAPFDVIVSNFSLLDDRTREILAGVKRHLAPAGSVVVQTTHPLTTRGDAPYVDAWRVESFDNFGGDFRAPMPWYFRTISSWSAAFTAGGYVIAQLREPLHPTTALPASLLIIARSANQTAGESATKPDLQ